MTLKIPLAPFAGTTNINRLQDLDYDEQFQRVKRFWMARMKAGQTNAFPVAFADAGR